VLAGLHHLAISVTPESWRQSADKLDAAAVPFQVESGTSIYFRDPDGAASNFSPSHSARCTATPCSRATDLDRHLWAGGRASGWQEPVSNVPFPHNPDRFWRAIFFPMLCYA